MITVYWKSKKVARFDGRRLTEATAAFQRIWKEFQEKGVTVSSAGKQMKGALVDGEEQTKALGSFLVQLELAGYKVVDSEPI